MRRTQTVNDLGVASTTTVPTPSVPGVVYPSNENDLKRFPDLQIQSKAITVVCQFALRGESEVAGTEFQPDVIVWSNDNYVVRALDDWSQYAAGFILAICTSIDLVDSPPTTE
jgi:hypothetical protein